MNRFEIIAHRGASADAPENTLASVNLGWKQNADAVEIDIHLSSDGKIVVIHDDTAKRTAGGGDVRVVEQTLEQLRELDAGRWKGARFAGERIPTLDEVVRTIPDGTRLFIEIKTGPEIVPELKRVLREAGKTPAQTPLIGFSYEAMRAAKAALPDLKVFWLAQVESDKETGVLKPTAAELIEKTKAAGLDGLDLGSSIALPAQYVEPIQAAGLELYVWTVNDPERARHYRGLGVLGITTDKPAALREALE